MKRKTKTKTFRSEAAAICERLHLTKMQLATLLGAGWTTLTRWMRAGAPPPRLTQLQQDILAVLRKFPACAIETPKDVLSIDGPLAAVCAMRKEVVRD